MSLMQIEGWDEKAAARQRGPYNLLSIEELKALIKERSGTLGKTAAYRYYVMIELDRQREVGESLSQTAESGAASGRDFGNLICLFM